MKKLWQPIPTPSGGCGPQGFLATECNHYNAVMGDCLFLTDQHLYLRKTVMNGFSTLFYRASRD